MSVSTRTFCHKMLNAKRPRDCASTCVEVMSIDSAPGDPLPAGVGLMANIIAELGIGTMDTTEWTCAGSLHPSETKRPHLWTMAGPSSTKPLFCIDPTEWIDCGPVYRPVQ